MQNALMHYLVQVIRSLINGLQKPNWKHERTSLYLPDAARVGVVALGDVQSLMQLTGDHVGRML